MKPYQKVIRSLSQSFAGVLQVEIKAMNVTTQQDHQPHVKVSLAPELIYTFLSSICKTHTR